MLAAAVAAAYMNKTVAHIEGGDVTGTIDESVRHALQSFRIFILLQMMNQPSELSEWGKILNMSKISALRMLNLRRLNRNHSI